MAAIKREPIPPGPIADLFNRLDDLHSKAGRPSMREIAVRAGRGNVSSSTVHNLFRKPQVPRWPALEHVVKALGGGPDRAAFLELWEAAWRAENDVAEPRGAAADPDLSPGYAPENQDLPFPAGPAGGVLVRPLPTLRPSHRIWSSEIPPGNPNFTGREPELARLRENLSSRQAPHVQVISHCP